MMPLLSVFFSVVGSSSAAAVACGVMGLDVAVFWEQYAKVVDKIDVIHCIVKGGSFGLVLTSVGCFYGYRAYGGASAVGSATRNTVVVSCLSILLVDSLLTSILPFGFPILKVS